MLPKVKVVEACSRSIEEVFEEAYMEVMTLQFRDKCHYATAECQSMLNNLYSCGSGQPGIEAAHPMIQAVVTKRGREVALDSAQVGHPSLHAGEEDIQIDLGNILNGESGNSEDTLESGGNGPMVGLCTALVMVSTSMLLVGL